jgi:hypothetical protein
MSDWNLPREGGCLCGRVRMRISKPPLLTMACHCTGCQRLTASAYSLSAAIPADGFGVIQGEPVIGALHGAAKHYFCGYCMSWMFTRPDQIDWFVNVRPTMFDDTSQCAPFVQTWTKEKLDWAQTPAKHSFEEVPPMDAYEGLLKDYAAQATAKLWT